MGYKIITMKRQLLLYLIKLFMGIVIIIICWLALTNIFVECGVIIPANYSETILEENRKRLDDIQQITDNDLPYGSKYSIFDLDYNYERGTMNKSDIEVTKKILLGKESNLQGNYVYSVIARTEEYCVIKYNIKARFNSDNKIFNYIDYDNLSYITMVLVFLLYKVLIRDILYFESSKRKVFIVTREETFEFYGKLNEIENSLKVCKISFLRVHQSFLVNYKHIKGQSYDFVVMDNGKKISISEDRRKLISEQYCSMEDTYYVDR